MRFIIIAFTLAITVISVAIAPVQAQQTGATISGQIILQDGGPVAVSVFVLPADTAQPAQGSDAIFAGTGNFAVSQLGDGEYLIVLQVSLERVLSPVPETVLFKLTPRGVHTFPAIRVSITDGVSVEGLEITVGPPDNYIIPPGGFIPPGFIPPGGFSPPNGVSGIAAPSLGAGNRTDAGGTVGAYIGLGVAAAVLLLFAGGAMYALRRP